MSRHRLFVAQTVHVEEIQWFAAGALYGSDRQAVPMRFERTYSIHVTLFHAENEEAAYRRAIEAAANETDMNCDPPGDRTLYYTLGLHELEEYPNADDFDADLKRQGVWIAAISPRDVDAAGIPLVRAKDELELFRFKNTLEA